MTPEQISIVEEISGRKFSAALSHDEILEIIARLAIELMETHDYTPEQVKGLLSGRCLEQSPEGPFTMKTIPASEFRIERLTP